MPAQTKLIAIAVILATTLKLITLVIDCAVNAPTIALIALRMEPLTSVIRVRLHAIWTMESVPAMLGTLMITQQNFVNYALMRLLIAINVIIEENA